MSDETTITPALTPEEWGYGPRFHPRISWGDGWFAQEYTDPPKLPAYGVDIFIGKDGFAPLMPRPHALAALCLYGMPFGFTQEMVRFLREEQARAIQGRGGPKARMFGEIADRIEVLLPPSP